MTREQREICRVSIVKTEERIRVLYGFWNSKEVNLLLRGKRWFLPKYIVIIHTYFYLRTYLLHTFGSLSICHLTTSMVITLVRKSTWGRKFSFFLNSGRKMVGILRKSGNFLKCLNSFLIMEHNDVKIKHAFVSLAPLFAWWIKIMTRADRMERFLKICWYDQLCRNSCNGQFCCNSC